MTNNNCLEGLICPECKSKGPFFIVATAEFAVYDEGTSEFSGVEWSDDSHIRCPCGRQGVVRDFQKDEENGS